jgi:hypothetical protein
LEGEEDPMPLGSKFTRRRWRTSLSKYLRTDGGGGGVASTSISSGDPFYFGKEEKKKEKK